MPDRNSFDKRELNAIERDRMARRQQLRRKSMITNALVVAVVLVVVVGIIVAIVAFAGRKKPATKASETTVITETIASDADKDKGSDAAKALIATEAGSASSQPASTLPSAEQNNDDNDNDSSAQTSSQSASSSADAGTGSTGGSGSASTQGGALHYTASGYTSEGWDYTYNYDPSYVTVSCSYSNGQYDFAIQGVSEGTTTLTLYYNVDDATQAQETMTVYVDSNLNVTQVG